MADTQVKDQPWGTYWDNEGKYQEQYTKAWEKLIPPQVRQRTDFPKPSVLSLALATTTTTTGSVTCGETGMMATKLWTRTTRKW